MLRDHIVTCVAFGPRRACLVAGAFSILLASRAIGQVRTGAEPSRLELSCRAIGPMTSEADLIARFGRVNVVRDSIVGSDDGPQPGTVIFPNRPDARAQVFWADPETPRKISAIAAGETATAWKTVTGIATRTTLRDLERMNGRPFLISGFWQSGGIGGTVISWQGGRLEPPKSSRCELHVQLQPAYDGSDDQAAFRQVQTGPSYSSSLPALQRLNPRVVSLSLWFR